MISRWTSLPFERAFVDVSAGNIKLQTDEYLPNGSFPVVDQGKDLIAGYTDNTAALVNADLPVIVFGDHTTIFKYIDFPFCIGADGVRLLKPVDRLDTKYALHFLNTVELPSAGYSRHFKFLKRIKISFPPVYEQRQIAAVLDQANDLRRKRLETINKSENLVRSIFISLFGQKDIWSSRWPREKLSAVVHPKQWKTISAEELTDSGFPVYGANGVIGFYDQYNHSTRTVLITCRGATCGTINVCEPKSYVTGNAMALDDPDARLQVPFLEWVLRIRGTDDAITGSAQPQITRQSLESVTIPLPPITLQRAFAARVAEIDKLKAQHRAHLAKLDALFASLQHRAFRGEL